MSSFTRERASALTSEVYPRGRQRLPRLIREARRGNPAYVISDHGARSLRRRARAINIAEQAGSTTRGRSQACSRNKYRREQADSTTRGGSQAARVALHVRRWVLGSLHASSGAYPKRPPCSCTMRGKGGALLPVKGDALTPVRQGRSPELTQEV